MKLGLINTVFFDTEIDPFGDGLVIAKELGFDTIDICAIDGEMTDAQIGAVKRLSREHGLPIVAMPTAIFGFIDPNKPARQFAKDMGRRFVDLTVLLGARVMQIVNGEYFWQLETGYDKSWIFGKAVEGLRAVGEHAAAAGIRIAVELEPFRMSIVNNVDRMDEFLKAVDLPDTVMANVDCSHLYLAGVAPQEIQKLRGRIAHVHISDAIDKHGDLPPGRGKAPLQECVRQLKLAGFEGTVACELEWSPDRSRAAVIAWLREAADKTAELLVNVGARNAAHAFGLARGEQT